MQLRNGKLVKVLTSPERSVNKYIKPLRGEETVLSIDMEIMRMIENIKCRKPSNRTSAIIQDIERDYTYVRNLQLTFNIADDQYMQVAGRFLTYLLTL